MTTKDLWPGQFTFRDRENRHFTQVSVCGPSDLECIERVCTHGNPTILYNDGLHLYRGKGLPSQFYSGKRLIRLRYREFCGEGRYVNHARAFFQHLGHLYGINGGPAEIVVRIGQNSPTWRLQIAPFQAVVIAKYFLGRTQVLFTRTDTRFPNLGRW
jgi:hypothetical protein